MSEAAAKKNIETEKPVYSDVVYQDYGSLVCEILKSPNHMLKVGVFCPTKKEVTIGGLRMAHNWCILYDHLPKTGFSDSYIDPERFNKNSGYFFLKSTPIAYEDAVFLQKDEKVLFLDFEDLSSKECTIEWEDHGYYCLFHVTFEDGETKTLSTSNYNKSYCFLWK